MAKVLVVDDDRSIVELLKLVLTRDGHQVVIARNGREGLAMAESERPDLIVLDVMMPEMDGFSVSGSLFKNPELSKTPIMILTAKGSSRQIFELVPNVRLYMDKPFEPDEFRKNVRKLLPPASPNPPQAA